MTTRIQLNLRLDGRSELLEAIKEAAERQELSINAWCVRAFEQALGVRASTGASIASSDIEATVERLLERKLASLLDKELEERLGKCQQAA